VTPGLQARLDAVRARVGIADVVGGVVKLGKGRRPRGKCPFHGSKSDSFAVDPDRQRARCWGCDWSGDVVRFVQDYRGLSFMEALASLEEGAGIDARPAPAVQRVKRERPPADAIDSKAMGRHLWRIAGPDVAAIRTYLIACGVPADAISDARLADIRFAAAAPIMAWPSNRRPDSVPQAPAMVALVRRAGDWRPIGVHVTYLAPDLTGKMARARRDGQLYPARKMLGDVGGGAVVLGAYAPNLPLFAGEGIETTLSGMAIAGAGADAIGLAVLSLGNLQGHWRTVRGALPLYDPQPDGDRAAAVAFAHDGLVTGLIDADMKPLRGPIDLLTGQPKGVPLIERKGGPVVQRAMTTQERASVCAALFVRAWRDKGCRVRAVRPHMGQDFRDAALAAAGRAA